MRVGTQSPGVPSYPWPRRQYDPARRQTLVAVPRVAVKGRGFRGLGASGSSQATCTDPNYWNPSINTCCAPLGTPAGQDPCSILNQPGFLAAQAADVGPLGPNGVPLSSPNFGPLSPNNLADIADLPNNVQADVMECYENPGSSFVDSVGMRVNCPAQSTQAAPGINVSAYTYAELAQLLGPSVTPSVALAGNSPFAVSVNPGPGMVAPSPAGVYGGGGPSGAGAGAGGSSYPVTVRLVNASGGSNSSYKVGDAWTITVTGPPNSQVTASATQNGANAGSGTQMGVTDSNGSLVLTGTFAAAQVGSWVETWQVGGQSAGSISFAVAAPGAAAGGSGSSGGGAPPNSPLVLTPAGSGNCFTFYSSDTCIGPVGIMTALTIGGGLLVLSMFMGGRR